jgi:hypothetical protein
MLNCCCSSRITIDSTSVTDNPSVSKPGVTSRMEAESSRTEISGWELTRLHVLSHKQVMRRDAVGAEVVVEAFAVLQNGN